jgi:hypothetical protein
MQEQNNSRNCRVTSVVRGSSARWLEHGGNTKCIQIIICRSQTKVPVWKSKDEWENIIRMGLTELGCEGCRLDLAAL